MCGLQKNASGLSGSSSFTFGSWLGLQLKLAIMVVFLGIIPAQAQQSAAPVAGEVPLKVSTRLIAPFAIKQDAKYTGFSMDLWQALAKEMGRNFNIIEKGSLKDLLDSVQSKEADLAIAAISITAAREEIFDFSQPMFDAGLQIMVGSDLSDNGFSLTALKNLLTSGPMPVLWTILALLILVPAHIVWLFERRHPQSIVSHSYFPGIFQALWWATGAAHGQQLEYPRSAVGKTVAALSIFISVIFIAFFTANVTTALTVQQLKGDINGPDDLVGKRVATVNSSTAAGYLRSSNIQPLLFPTIDGAYEALRNKQVDAIVYDAPILLYHAANDGKGKTSVVGPMFRRESYGILFAQDSALRKPVNETLLKLRENGTYDILYRKWFAKEDKGS
jgi:polar amino acid transport system substrate-binding protein